MQRLLTLAITSIVVSLDSFVAGFSVSLNKRQNATLPAVVALVTFVMCLGATLAGYAVKNVLDEYVNVFGAIILVLLAVTNLLKKEDDAVNMQRLSLRECLTLGIAVGLDASVANLSLAVDGYGLVAPVVFAVTHYFTVLAGQLLAGKIVLRHTNVISATVLFALALTKLV